MSLVGGLAMALVTAFFISAVELAPDEAWLVRKIETQDELVKRERCALEVLQACVRVWLEVRHQKMKQQITGDAPSRRRSGTSPTPSPQPSLPRTSRYKWPGSSWRAAPGERMALYQAARDKAVENFRKSNGNISQLTDVYTLAVLHTSVEGLRNQQDKNAARLAANQERLESRLDALVAGVEALAARGMVSSAPTGARAATETEFVDRVVPI